MDAFDTIYSTCFSGEQENSPEKPLPSDDRNKLRSRVQMDYPTGDVSCEDRFAWLSIHFDGITTNRYGAGRSYEVLSVEIKNTPDENRSLRRFCCVLGVLKHEPDKMTADQPFIAALHTMIQLLVVSGLLGHYYYHDNKWYHIRWGALVLSGDTKAQEVLSGYTGKQMSRSYSLFSDAEKQMLNPRLGIYHPSGFYLTKEDSSLVTFETPWNRLDEKSFLRFFNIIASGDQKAIDMLKSLDDEEGKKEIESLKTLLQFLKKTKGWNPTTFPTRMGREIFCRCLLNAAVMTTKESAFPRFTVMEAELERRQKEKEEKKASKKASKKGASKKGVSKSRKRAADTPAQEPQPAVEETQPPNAPQVDDTTQMLVEEAAPSQTSAPAQPSSNTATAADGEQGTEEQRPAPEKVVPLHDLVKERLERDSPVEETVYQLWHRLVEENETLTPEDKAVAKTFFESFLRIYDSPQREPTIPPFDRHFPILPGLAFALDGMHMGSNFNQQVSKLFSNRMTDTAAGLNSAGFDDYARGMRQDENGESCFTVNKLVLLRGIQRLDEYVKKHPTYIPWLSPDMLEFENMKKLKSEWQFTMMFGVFFFAYQDFFREELFFVILACFDCIAFLYTARQSFKDIAEVQARNDYFLGQLANITYPGFLTPTVVNAADYFDSIVRAGPNSTYHNFGAESGYSTLINNDMGGCNPCKTISRRYNVLRVSEMFLFDYNCKKKEILYKEGDPVDLTNALAAGIPPWLINPQDTRFALENVMEDYQYYKDDSLVYDGLLFEMLSNPEADVGALLDTLLTTKKAEIDREFTVTESSVLRKSLTWDGTVYHSVFDRKRGTRAEREMQTPEALTVENLEFGKECFAITTDKKDVLQVLLVLGYIVSRVNGQPYPEAVGILLPTFCGSFVVDRCPRAVLDVDDEDFVACRYRYVRVSLYRLHVDTAIPFPLGEDTLVFYQNCLILRPSKRVPHHKLFRGEKEAEKAGMETMLQKESDAKDALVADMEVMKAELKEKDRELEEKDREIEEMKRKMEEMKKENAKLKRGKRNR